MYQETDQVPDFLQGVVYFLSECRTPLCNFVEHLLIFLQNTSQCFRRTLLNTLADQVWVFLQNTFQYFCRKLLCSFAKNLSNIFIVNLHNIELKNTLSRMVYLEILYHLLIGDKGERRRFKYY